MNVHIHKSYLPERMNSYLKPLTQHKRYIYSTNTTYITYI